MADKNMILSADAEEKLLKPIDEYVGKIQAQIDELRVDGSDKVRSLKNHIAIAKEDKNLSKEEKDSIIAKDKAALEKAKAVEAKKSNLLRLHGRVRNRQEPGVRFYSAELPEWLSDLQ